MRARTGEPRAASDDHPPPAARRSQVARRPALRRAVQEAFDSYARYWLESFRLPHLSPLRGRKRHRGEGYQHVVDGLEAGNGVILALPHLGGWEWAGRWLVDRGHGLTVVVEQIEPPELFEWFVELRSRLGMHVVPLGPTPVGEVMGALAQRHGVPAVRPRHPAQRGRGRVLRRAHDAAGRPVDARAAHRRPDPAHRRLLRPTATTATSAGCARRSPSNARAGLRDDVARRHPAAGPRAGGADPTRPRSGTSSSPTGRATPATRPSGQRGLYCYWRVGAGCVDTGAFGMLNVT
jgi:hypothetical protein